MKDSEIRGLVLRAFYEKRHEGFRPWTPADFPAGVGNEFYRIAQQLWQQNLLDWRGLENGSGAVVAGAGEINAYGVDVIEGNAESPISMIFDNRQTINITGSNNTIGSQTSFSSFLNSSEISTAIDSSNFSPAEKAEARSLWQKVSENKLLNTVIGSAVGELTKAALPK